MTTIRLHKVNRLTKRKDRNVETHFEAKLCDSFFKKKKKNWRLQMEDKSMKSFDPNDCFDQLCKSIDIVNFFFFFFLILNFLLQMQRRTTQDAWRRYVSD